MTSMLTRERAIEILELHKTTPQPLALVAAAIKFLGTIQTPKMENEE